jgi:hypothetical protein
VTFESGSSSQASSHSIHHGDIIISTLDNHLTQSHIAIQIDRLQQTYMSARLPTKAGAPASVIQGTSTAAPSHPLRQDFDTDPRVHFDQTAGKWQYEDDVTGQDFEWNEPGQTWMPVVSLRCFV